MKLVIDIPDSYVDLFRKEVRAVITNWSLDRSLIPTFVEILEGTYLPPKTEERKSLDRWEIARVGKTNKIQAIKDVRTAMNCGLWEAKIFVEAIVRLYEDNNL